MDERFGKRLVWISAISFSRSDLHPSSSNSVSWKGDRYEPYQYLPSGLDSAKREKLRERKELVPPTSCISPLMVSVRDLLTQSLLLGEGKCLLLSLL